MIKLGKNRSTSLALAACLSALVFAPNGASAQGPQRGATGRGIEFGVKAGVENQSTRLVAGALTRLQVIPRFELLGGVDFHFLPNLTERQFTTDVAFIASGGATYLGGGLVVRNSIFGEPGDPKENKTGGSLFLGVRGGGTGAVRNQIEVRWAKVGAFDSFVLSAGLTYRIPFGS